MIIKDLEILKKRSLITVVIIFIVILSLRIYSDFNVYNKQKTEQKNTIFRQTSYIYQSKLNIINRTFTNRLRSIVSQQKIIDAIKNKDRKTLYKISLERFKTVKRDFPTLTRMHFHLPDNTSFLRVHKPKEYGDNLKVKRPMIAKAIETKSTQIGFESGLHDKSEITYRVAIPIMDGDTLVSIAELGINTSGILKKLNKFFKASQNEKVYMGFLLRKKNAIEGKSINLDDYKLMANDKSISSMISKIDTSKIEQNINFNDRDYFVFWGKEKLVDFNTDQVGTILYAFDVTKLENNFKSNIALSIMQPLVVMSLFYLILLWLFNYIIKQSKLNHIKITSIVDNQEAIIVVTNGKKIIQANRSFLSFFNIDSLEIYFKDYDCICDRFENINGYLQKENDNIGWIKFMMSNTSQTHKVRILNKDGKAHTFQVNTKEFTQGKDIEYVVSFEDITILESEVAKNRQKDKQLLEQSRLAQMGEMISMIAHQWRQPLAAISSTAATITIKSRLENLDNEIAVELSEKISEYSNHLSSTIDDFRDFFKSNKAKQSITYDVVINDVLNIVEDSIINQNITLIKDLDSNIIFDTYANEIKQVILNLIKNAEDVLLENNIENPTITITTNENELIVSDDGGGIAEDIIDNIFDPYFSTKTKKDGTGLGLYMSKTIIDEHCGGKLSVTNDKDGAVFKIELKVDDA